MAAPALLLASLMLTASSAQAGNYTVIYTGGAPPTVAPAADSTGSSFSPGYQYATAVASASRMPSGPSSYTIQGNPSPTPITATFTWQPAAGQTITTDPPPPCIILEQTAGARWYVRMVSGTASGSGTCDCGTCDCGLPGEVTTNYMISPGCPAAYSSATYDKVLCSPGASFSVSCSPTASFIGQPGTDGLVGGEVDVQYSAAVFLFTLTLQGTTKDSSGLDNILIGQGCSGTLTADPFKLSNYAWTVPGLVFQNFVVAPDQSSAQANPMPSSAWSTPSPLWHWIRDETVTVSVQADASINGVFIGRVSAQKPVKIWAPDYLFKPLSGPVSVGNIQGYLELYGGGPAFTDANGHKTWDPPGMKNGGRVSTPNLFRLAPTGTAGTGSWEFGQLVSPGRWVYQHDGTGAFVTRPLNWNGLQGLDSGWPYGASDGEPAMPWPADSVDQSPQPNTPTYWMEDTPGAALLDSCYRCRIDESFNDFMMYLPPNSGLGSEWVPLHLYTWKWQADISQTSTSWTLGWTPNPPGYTSDVSSLRCTTHPNWIYRITAGSFYY